MNHLHIEDKPRALANIIDSLNPGCRLVISLECVDEWLDYGSRQIRQYPVSQEELLAMLKDCGFRVAEPVAVVLVEMDRSARTSFSRGRMRARNSFVCLPDGVRG